MFSCSVKSVYLFCYCFLFHTSHIQREREPRNATGYHRHVVRRWVNPPDVGTDHKIFKNHYLTAHLCFCHRTDTYKHLYKHRNFMHANCNIWISLTGHRVNAMWVVSMWVGRVGEGERSKPLITFVTCRRLLTTTVF